MKCKLCGDKISNVEGELYYEQFKVFSIDDSMDKYIKVNICSLCVDIIRGDIPDEYDI